MRQPIDLVGGFYTDESLPWSCQDTVNWIPVAAEVGGTRTPTKLVDAPGLRPWVWIGNHADGVDSAPIRGLHDVEGQLFAVCGQTLYRIRPDGIAIPLGTIPGVGRVSMSHNQQAVGNQLLVVNGTGGYVWNTGTEEFTVVTDDGYPGAFAVDFLDGYLMQVEPFGRFLFHSDLADALDYNTLDRFEAETAPDRVVGMIVNHREVWAFGERTIDIFDNVGTATGTFQNKGISLSRGCIAKWSPAVIDNGIAWLGDDRVVYHARGYDAIRISTRAIEVALAEIPLTDIRNAFSFVWADRGHAVYYLTVPNGQTFGYDFSTGLWHRRASWHPERDIGGRWRLNDLVRHNGRWIGGDYQTGKLYELDWDYMMEGCEELVRERVSPVAHDDGRRFTLDSLEGFFEVGGSGSECVEFALQPVGPSISGEAPGGIVFVEYDYSYSVSAGDAPITEIELVEGALPDGLVFEDGRVYGTPTETGAWRVRVRVVDANGLQDYLDDEIAVSTRVIAFGRLVSTYYTTYSPDGQDWSAPLSISPWSDRDFLPIGAGRVLAFKGAWVPHYTDDFGATWVESDAPDVNLAGHGGTRFGGRVILPRGGHGIAESLDRGVTFTLVDEHKITRCAFGPDGGLLATVYGDGRLFYGPSGHAVSPGVLNNVSFEHYGGIASVGELFVIYGGGSTLPRVSFTDDGSRIVRTTDIPTAPGRGGVVTLASATLGGETVIVFLVRMLDGGPIEIWWTDDFAENVYKSDVALPALPRSIVHNGSRFILGGGSGAGGTDGYIMTCRHPSEEWTVEVQKLTNSVNALAVVEP